MRSPDDKHSRTRTHQAWLPPRILWVETQTPFKSNSRKTSMAQQSISSPYKTSRPAARSTAPAQPAHGIQHQSSTTKYSALKERAWDRQTSARRITLLQWAKWLNKEHGKQTSLSSIKWSLPWIKQLRITKLVQGSLLPNSNQWLNLKLARSTRMNNLINQTKPAATSMSRLKE